MESVKKEEILSQIVALGTNVDLLKSELEKTIEEERNIKEQINISIGNTKDAGKSSQEHFDKSLVHLKENMPVLDSVLGEASKLEKSLLETRKKADKVSERVRQLDLARNRALQTWNIVRVKIIIKECMQKAQQAMQQEDYEAAAEQIHIYHQVSGAGGLLGANDQISPESRISPTAEQHMILNLENELRDRVLTEINLSVERNIEQDVFKRCVTFAKLGLGREGVSRFMQFLRNNLKMDAESCYDGCPHKESPVFDGIGVLGALITKAQQLISKYRKTVDESFGEYGSDGGALISAVHSEFDQHACKTINQFIKTRQLKERVKIANQPNTNSTTKALISDTMMRLHADKTTWLDASPLEALDDLLFQIAQVVQLLTNYDRYIKYEESIVHDAKSKRLHSTYNQFIEKAEEERQQLSQVRSHRYPRRTKSNSVTDPSENGVKEAVDTIQHRMDEAKKQLEEQLSEAILPPNMEYCNVLQELAGIYISLYAVYMEDAIALAQSIEATIPILSGPMENRSCLCSSIADDCFSIIRTALERSMATGHVDSACGVINLSVSVLEDDVASLFKSRIHVGTSDLQNLAVQGQAHLERLRGTVSMVGSSMNINSDKTATKLSNTGAGDGGERAAASGELTSQATTLNSLNECCKNIKLLHSLIQLQADENMQEDHEISKVRNRGEELLDVEQAFQKQLLLGLEKSSETIKPELVQQLKQVFGKDGKINYVLNEKQFELAQGKAESILDSSFIATLDAAMSDLSTGLVEETLSKLFVKLAKYVANLIESSIMENEFTYSGSILLDQQLRRIMDYFLKHIEGKIVRASFTRIVHIVMLINMQRPEEVYDWQDQSRMLKLSAKDLKKILHLRKDFDKNSVNRLKL